MRAERLAPWSLAALSFAALSVLPTARAQESRPASRPDSRPASRPAGLAVGDLAPDFSLKDHTGTPRSLAEFVGRRLVLFFYPKADTPGCTVESCGFRDRAADFEKAGIALAGASFDTVEDNAAFARKHRLPFPLLCDTEKTLAVAYGAAEASSPVPQRHTIVIGVDGRIEKIYRSVSPKDHPDAVLRDLAAVK